MPTEGALFNQGTCGAWTNLITIIQFWSETLEDRNENQRVATTKYKLWIQRKMRKKLKCRHWRFLCYIPVSSYRDSATENLVHLLKMSSWGHHTYTFVTHWFQQSSIYCRLRNGSLICEMQTVVNKPNTVLCQLKICVVRSMWVHSREIVAWPTDFLVILWKTFTHVYILMP